MDWTYVLRVLNREKARLEQDFFPLSAPLVNQRVRALEKAIKVFTEGKGYLGPCEHRDGSKVVLWNEIK